MCWQEGGKLTLPQEPRCRATFPRQALHKRIKEQLMSPDKYSGWLELTRDNTGQLRGISWSYRKFHLGKVLVLFPYRIHRDRTDRERSKYSSVNTDRAIYFSVSAEIWTTVPISLSNTVDISLRINPGLTNATQCLRIAPLFFPSPLYKPRGHFSSTFFILVPIRLIMVWSKSHRSTVNRSA
jgi:hypothetical protein